MKALLAGWCLQPSISLQLCEQGCAAQYKTQSGGKHGLRQSAQSNGMVP